MYTYTSIATVTITFVALAISLYSFHYHTLNVVDLSISPIEDTTKKMPLNPANFPRPPLLERITKHLQVKWPNGGPIIADTKQAYWVLETHHPPTYYIPPSDIQAPLTKTSRKTYCEWKGSATYFSIHSPVAANTTVDNRAWTYESPTPSFRPIKDYVSFYEGPWECYVDGERVQAQPGDFYGGWVTSEIQGKVKGGPGTWGW